MQLSFGEEYSANRAIDGGAGAPCLGCFAPAADAFTTPWAVKRSLADETGSRSGFFAAFRFWLLMLVGHESLGVWDSVKRHGRGPLSKTQRNLSFLTSSGGHRMQSYGVHSTQPPWPSLPFLLL